MGSIPGDGGVRRWGATVSISNDHRQSALSSWLPLVVIFVSGIVVGVWLNEPGQPPSRVVQLPPAPPSALAESRPQSQPRALDAHVSPFSAALSPAPEISMEEAPEVATIASAPPASAAPETVAALTLANSLEELREAFSAALSVGDRRRLRRLRKLLLEKDAYSGLTLVSDAEWLHFVGRNEIAIRQLMELQSYERDPGILGLIQQRLDDWLPPYFDTLMRGRDRERQLAFLNYLVVQQPQNSRYRWELALLQFKLKDYQNAVITLSTLLYDPVWGPKAGALQQRIDQRLALQGDYDLRLPIESVGNQHVLSVRVNGSAIVRLLIDTGATRTLLIPAAVERAGLSLANPVGKVQVSTASDIVEALLVRCSIDLEPHSITGISSGVLRRDYDVFVYDSPMSGGIEGLLGMDVLGQFRFYIDQQEDYLYLRHKL